ncbi:MAG: ABC transporter ATP-binding protein [Gemmatimonadota bacterium]
MEARDIREADVSAVVRSEPLVDGPIIETRGLSHRFGQRWALEDVNLEIPRGSLYALLGPNGAGKTTLLKILMGLIHPTSGSALLNGRPIGSTSVEHRSRVGYVAEGQELPGWMTLDVLKAYLAPLYPTWDHGLADTLTERFRLPSKARIRRMSRGERMKTALLAALAPRPEVLIMDEPFTGMDALVKDELIYGLLELSQNDSWTVLLCSHDIGELEHLADWVGFLDRGKLIVSEPMDVLHGRFQRVELTLRPGTLTDLNGLPPTWLSPKRSGSRLSFVSCDHGVEGWDAEVRSVVPQADRVSTQGATLRDVFVALAAEGLGGRDWEREGGLS